MLYELDSPPGLVPAPDTSALGGPPSVFAQRSLDSEKPPLSHPHVTRRPENDAARPLSFGYGRRGSERDLPPFTLGVSWNFVRERVHPVATVEHTQGSPLIRRDWRSFPSISIAAVFLSLCAAACGPAQPLGAPPGSLCEKGSATTDPVGDAPARTRVAESVRDADPASAPTAEATRTSLFVIDPLGVAHSHNDYDQEHPLWDALRAGFASVEADVWWNGNDVVISHLPMFELGTLEELYLRPLQDLVDRRGSVHGDGRTFNLWLDLKESGRPFTEALATMLARYPMLAIFSEQGVRGGPVVVILTGNETAKSRLVEEHRELRACRDSNRWRREDPPADARWTWYALRWSQLTGWDGQGKPDPAELRHLRDGVARIHALGRRLRLFHVPEQPAAWGAAIEAGVDLIGTDHPAELRTFLDRLPRPVAWTRGLSVAAR